MPVRTRILGGVVALLAATAASLVPVLPAGASDGPDQADDGGLSASVVAQINAITQEKASRTPAERKVDTRLLYSSRRAAGREAVRGAPTLRTAAEVGADGLTEVDIDGLVTDQLLERIQELGGSVVTAVASMDAIRARIPLSAVAPLSEEADIHHLRVADQFMSNQIDELTSAIGAADPGPITNAGSALSEADATHLAGATRTTYGVDGTGVTIGVLSDGVNTLAARQATGDLPAVTVIAGQAGSGDEGTAMLELVHDLAPGAALMFATALGGQPQFASNILALQAGGADIIVDDITYFAESVFQPGIVEQAVDTVVAAGVVYLSSAGNSGNVPDGTSGTWVGPFASAGAAGGVLAGAGTLLDFDPTAGVDSSITLAQNTGPVVGLTWSDPLGGSGNDYDLYVLNAAQTTIFDAGANTQDGNDDPIEFVAQSFTNENLVVAKFSGADRHISLITNRGRFTAYGTGGASYGHNSGENAISVAATPAFNAFSPGHPVGPFPGPFTNANVSEFFSSDGPRLNFFETDGTPIAGGETLTKPDLTAADGTVTTTPGFVPFFGTSAAAPHAAAIAALMMDANPASTGAQIRTALEASTIDIEAAGDDAVTGTGILMASTAVAAVANEGQMQFSSATYSVNENGGSATLTLTRTGGSDGAASAQVALAGGGTATGGGVDFTFATQTVNWAAGDAANKTVTVPIVDDPTFEGSETANFVLQNPTVAVLGAPTAATLTILDDEAPPAPGSVVFSSATYTTGEAGPTATITVDRVGGSSGAASVQVALGAGSTATNGTDFAYSSPQTVSWVDGALGSRQVTVTINQDTVDEPNETVNLVLQNAVTATIGTPSAATLTIVDDDAAPPPPFEPPSNPNPPDPDDPTGREVHRLAGDDRIATAIAASQDAWPSGSADTVVLARSDTFADALVGVPLAHAGNGPLLLTPQDSLDPRVRTEIDRVLGDGHTIHVLGGARPCPRTSMPRWTPPGSTSSATPAPTGSTRPSWSPPSWARPATSSSPPVATSPTRSRPGRPLRRTTASSCSPTAHWCHPRWPPTSTTPPPSWPSAGRQRRPAPARKGSSAPTATPPRSCWPRPSSMPSTSSGWPRGRTSPTPCRAVPTSPTSVGRCC